MIKLTKAVRAQNAEVVKMEANKKEQIQKEGLEAKLRMPGEETTLGRAIRKTRCAIYDFGAGVLSYAPAAVIGTDMFCKAVYSDSPSDPMITGGAIALMLIYGGIVHGQLDKENPYRDQKKE